MPDENGGSFAFWQAPDRDAVHVIDTSGPLDHRVSILTRMEGRDGHDENLVRTVTGETLRRPRRQHKALERMGVLYRHDGRTRLTDLGRMLRGIEEGGGETIRRVEKAALQVLKKFQLNNPADRTSSRFYPDDCDIHPYWAMWKAASNLGWRLHCDELNRELMRVLRTAELDEAIERIAGSRVAAGYSPFEGGAPGGELRERCHDEDPEASRPAEAQLRDHICTPFFRRAGFGEVFFKHTGDGWYEVPENVRDLVTEALDPPPEFVAYDDPEEWMEYYGAIGDQLFVPRLTVNWHNPEPDLGSLQGVKDSYIAASAALRSGKHIVLFGPPGTGKSELAFAICRAHGVTPYSTTATGDWTTFETIGGYLPDPRQEGESLNFFPGSFLRSIEESSWLIIDELNRADIDKAFGELFTVLSGHPVTLPYMKRNNEGLIPLTIGLDDSNSISIPDSWRILGTMNTFDKASLFQLSFAFMRRFAFVPVSVPDFDTYSAIIRAEMESLSRETSDSDGFWTDLGELTIGLFAKEDAALGAVGNLDLRVGPAIALDVLRYARERRTAQGEAARAVTVLTEALPLFLFPQFEGRHREHPDIVLSLKNALALDDDVATALERHLLAWTGYDPLRS